MITIHSKQSEMKNIKFNFEADYVQYITNRISDFGYDTTDIPKDTLDVLYTYHSIKRRLVPIRKREIFESQDFKCPESVKTGYSNFINDCLSGYNLNRYLSKSIQYSNKEDLLLNDWGIYHFHLGERPDTKNLRFIQRTNELLFAIITPSALYCIGIFLHGDWAEQSILSVIEKNWPFLIEPYQIKGNNLNSTYHITNKELNELRKNGINTPVRTDSGNFYFGMGGGINGAGGSTQAFDYAQNDLHLIQRLTEKFRSLLSIYNLDSDTKATFHLNITPLTISAYSAELGINILLKSYPPRPIPLAIWQLFQPNE